MCLFFGLTQKQALRLGKAPPVSPKRMATRQAAGPHLAEGSCRSCTPDQRGDPGFDSCLDGFGLLLPQAGASQAQFPLHLMLLGVESGAAQP